MTNFEKIYEMLCRREPQTIDDIEKTLRYLGFHDTIQAVQKQNLSVEEAANDLCNFLIAQYKEPIE